METALPLIAEWTKMENLRQFYRQQSLDLPAVKIFYVGVIIQLFPVACSRFMIGIARFTFIVRLRCKGCVLLGAWCRLLKTQIYFIVSP